MTVGNAVGGRSRNLILAAMIFAVAMTFIDQTIVSIADQAASLPGISDLPGGPP
jgi:hypothetical protein